MKENQSCRECGKMVPQRNNQVSFACQMLHLCKRCYLERFPKRHPGIVIEGYQDDYEPNSSPYGWLDQFHGSMR